MSILIIDDSKHFCKLLKGILTKKGFNDVIVAESVSDAFSIMGIDGSAGSSPKIDLILLDIVMPEIDGIEVCIKIKAVESYKDVPVILVTSEADQNKLQQGFDAGAVDLIKKPMDREDFLAKIFKYMKNEP